MRSQRKACLPGSLKPAGETGREKAWLSHRHVAWETARPECPQPARPEKGNGTFVLPRGLHVEKAELRNKDIHRAAPEAEECTGEERAPRPSAMQGRVRCRVGWREAAALPSRAPSTSLKVGGCDSGRRRPWAQLVAGRALAAQPPSGRQAASHWARDWPRWACGSSRLPVTRASAPSAV